MRLSDHTCRTDFMTEKIRGLKEVGSDGEDGNRVVFEAVQGVSVETEVLC